MISILFIYLFIYLFKKGNATVWKASLGKKVNYSKLSSISERTAPPVTKVARSVSLQKLHQMEQEVLTLKTQPKK